MSEAKLALTDFGLAAQSEDGLARTLELVHGYGPSAHCFGILPGMMNLMKSIQTAD